MSSEPSAPVRPRSAARERWTIVLAAVIVLIQLLTLPIVFSLADERDPTGGEESEDDEAEAVPEIDPQEFSGKEPGRTEAFPIEGGLTVFEIDSTGGGNFIAVLEDEEFQRVTGLANVIGEFRGSTARHLEAGDYVLAMNGREWSVTVTQPRHDEGDTLPVSFSGESFTATEPFEVEAPEDGDEEKDAGENENANENTSEDGDASENGNAGEDENASENENAAEDGEPGENENAGENGTDESPDAVDEAERERTVRFAITHEGEGNVRMRLLDREGRRVTGVLNDRGSVDAVETVELPPGVYLLDVQAEGDWTIDIEFG